MSSISRGPLPQHYIDMLQTMSLGEIAAIAAINRADGSPGSTTKLIIRWMRHRSDLSTSEFNVFLLIYNDFWQAVKAARQMGRMPRPANRPVKTSYRPRSHAGRPGLVMAPA